MKTSMTTTLGLNLAGLVIKSRAIIRRPGNACVARNPSESQWFQRFVKRRSPTRRKKVGAKERRPNKEPVQRCQRRGQRTHQRETQRPLLRHCERILAVPFLLTESGLKTPDQSQPTHPCKLQSGQADKPIGFSVGPQNTSSPSLRSPVIAGGTSSIGRLASHELLRMLLPRHAP